MERGAWLTTSNENSPVGSNAGSTETTASGVSWGAVIAGAFVAAAMSLILLALGTGLGLSSISPWSSSSASRDAVGVGIVLWLIFAQIWAFGLGGYVAGRLRIKWATVHTDEVYFRDTAHGLLVWAVAAAITAGLLGSAATSMVGARAGETATPNGAAGASAETTVDHVDPLAYSTDALFRSTRADRAQPELRAEVERVLATAVHARAMADADKAYLDSLTAEHTGLAPADADRRVIGVFADLQQTIDTTRKHAAKLSLWIFVALLTGAFCSSVAATIGGRQRDHVVHT